MNTTDDTICTGTKSVIVSVFLLLAITHAFAIMPSCAKASDQLITHEGFEIGAGDWLRELLTDGTSGWIPATAGHPLP